ncbi:MAG TPA: DUF92 domain-containing protein [Anaerolineales bacterium]|nr:DUF92 domain-containing protein [Anaerolineales bacterium]
MQFGLGLGLGALIAYLAYRAGALQRSGAWAAGLVGGLVFGLGGLPWAGLLVTFFISSSLLSRAYAQRKNTLSEKFSKGSRRDYGQVLANGGLGVLLACLHALFPDQIWVFVAFAGSMAAVNADTWATELGVLSPVPARLITTGRVVQRGASGGITLLGYLAALGGAVVIGLLAGAFVFSENFFTLAAVVILAGLVGSTFDSFLGATVQGIYFCPVCQKETESHPLHRCGNETSHLRGWKWLDNDWVNFLSALVGALVSFTIWKIFL